MSCNFASILQYGDPEAVMAMEFCQKGNASATETYQLNWTSGLDIETKMKEASEPTDPSVYLPPMALQGTVLSFHTLAVLLDCFGDPPSIYPSMHISLSFIWGLALHPKAMQRVDKFIPWTSIATFLNTLIGTDINFDKIEDKALPLYDGATRQLPEDFLIRGQSWSQRYFPDDFFEDAPSEGERPVIEEPFIAIHRKHRCLWLGVRIAKVCSNFLWL